MGIDFIFNGKPKIGLLLPNSDGLYGLIEKGRLSEQEMVLIETGPFTKDNPFVAAIKVLAADNEMITARTVAVIKPPYEITGEPRIEQVQHTSLHTTSRIYTGPRNIYARLESGSETRPYVQLLKGLLDRAIHAEQEEIKQVRKKTRSNTYSVGS